MADLAPSLHYTPLPKRPSTRILWLQPAARVEDALVCHLQVIDLEEAPLYFALSYVWGEESNPSTLLVDQGTLHITRNLDAALRRLRIRSESRPFWVDSVCIDQQNIQERSSQVGIMHEIYEKAEEVIIWLGSENEGEDTKAAYEGMRILTKTVGYTMQVAGQKEVPLELLLSRKAAYALAGLDHPSPHQPQIAAFRDFCTKRPWYQRAWTFQESYMARKKSLLCGDLPALAPEDFASGLFYLKALEIWTGVWTDVPSHYPALHSIQSSRTRPTSSLLELLRTRRGSGCKDPSDIIYSLLGVSGNQIQMVPDYRLPFQTVFAEATGKLIQHSKSLQILFSVDDHASPEARVLPSWVPDWRIRWRNEEIGSQMRYFSAAGMSSATSELSSDYAVLKVLGLPPDSVDDFLLPGVSTETQQWLERRVPKMHDEANHYYLSTTETLSVAVYRTMVMDRALLEDRSVALHRCDPASDPLLRGILRDNPGRRIYAGLADLWSLTDGHTLFITQNGRLGSTARSLQKGDLVTVLMGCELPVILRPLGQTYSFVGLAYVHGIMDGEALIEARKSTDESYDRTDLAWLKELSEEPMPFNTQLFEFV